MFRLSERSRKNLEGVHPDLVRVVEKALEITPIDFAITEGLRDKARQAELVKQGASQTSKSRHLTGHAVDVMACGVADVWKWDHYIEIAKAFKQAAADLAIPINWGGDWHTLKDGPHFELSRTKYP